MSITQTTHQQLNILINRSNEVLVQTVCKTAKQIAGDSDRRISGYHSNIQELAKGVFYAREYAAKLKEVGQAKRLDYLINRNSIYFGLLPRSHFKKLSDKVGCFALKNGALPSEAIDSAIKGLSLVGCGEVCQLTQWQGIRKVLGDKKFDALFSAETKTPLIIGNNAQNPLVKFRIYLVKCPAEEIKPGDHVYISSISNYDEFHPSGESPGYNAICISADSGKDPKFAVHGLSPDGSTVEEASENLYKDLNEEPIRLEDITSKKFAANVDAQTPKTIKLTKEEFQSRGGGTLIAVSRIDPKRITLLAINSIEEGREYLESWTAQSL